MNDAIAHARTLSAAFAAYLSQGGRSLEDFKNFKESVVSGPEVSADLKTKLQTLYQKNYEHEGYSAEAIAKLTASFANRLEQTTTRVWHWQLGDEDTLAFAAATENEDTKSAYISGLNINPDLKTSKAGKELLEQIIEHYRNESWVIKAEAAPENFRGYAEMEWVGTTVKPDELGQERYLVDMSIFPNHFFPTKQMSRSELISKLHSTSPDPDIRFVVTQSNDEAPTIPAGFVITRTFRQRDKETSSDRHIFALEPTPTTAPTMPQT